MTSGCQEGLAIRNNVLKGTVNSRWESSKLRAIQAVEDLEDLASGMIAFCLHSLQLYMYVGTCKDPAMHFRSTMLVLLQHDK